MPSKDNRSVRVREDGLNRQKNSNAASASPRSAAARSRRATPLAEPLQRGLKRAELAYVELASSEIARDINRDLVLEIIRSQQPVSRADVARVSGLQASTVSNIVDQLLREKWIMEGAVAKRPRGRRPTLLSLNDELVILVADVRPTKAILAVVDLNGRLLAQEQCRVTQDAQRSVQNIAEAMLAMQGRFPNKTFEGVGISVPGRVHPLTNQLILAPNLPWVGYDLKTHLESALGLQVELDNDATACLLAELWFGRMDGVRNAVLISLSEGLGTAILANGHIVTGLNGLAGEFGHISLDSNGPLCGCGRNGCWETLASSRAAMRYYMEQSPEQPVSSMQELLGMAEAEDPAAVRAIETQARHLGRGLRLVTAALSPELILITGALTTCWQRVGPIVEQELRASVLAGSPPRLDITTEGEIARLRGAAAVALQRHSGYNRSTPQVRRDLNKRLISAAA